MNIYRDGHTSVQGGSKVPQGGPKASQDSPGRKKNLYFTKVFGRFGEVWGNLWGGLDGFGGLFVRAPYRTPF